MAHVIEICPHLIALPTGRFPAPLRLLVVSLAYLMQHLHRQPFQSRNGLRDDLVQPTGALAAPQYENRERLTFQTQRHPGLFLLR